MNKGLQNAMIGCFVAVILAEVAIRKTPLGDMLK